MRVILSLLMVTACVDESLTLDDDSALLGASSELFTQALPGTNGRSCATCHVLADHTALSPARVAALPASDPLFHPLDADDPDASPLTFEHLRAGLVRVSLRLPANMDIIDAAGAVITPAHRTVSVWRGVPTIENVAYSGPFQLDGRETDLRQQAQSALIAHSQGPTLSGAQLQRIAQFERATFSSSRAQFVAAFTALGVPSERIPMPENFIYLTPAERRGQRVYDKACAACHGGGTTSTIVDRAAHDALFFALNPDGTVIHDLVDGRAVPRTVPHASEFMNIGFSLLSGYGQIGLLPMANAHLPLPRYRFRFYTDATRTSAVVDLPPIPRDGDGNLVAEPDITIYNDASGRPIVGPSLGPEWFTSDPGRALITGNPLDFNTFDIPQLRGIARTAPYMHDNSHATLRDVVDSYSRFIVGFLPSLNLPTQYQDSPDSPFLESLTLAEKLDLIAFLEKL